MNWVKNQTCIIHCYDTFARCFVSMYKIYATAKHRVSKLLGKIITIKNGRYNGLLNPCRVVATTIFQALLKMKRNELNNKFENLFYLPLRYTSAMPLFKY